MEHNENLIYHNRYNCLDLNGFFKKELETFIKGVENNEKTNIPVSEGRKSLVMAISMHKSLKIDSIVNVLV